ncbi:MAG: twin-arginine translocation signal domain-containing protein [Gemmatimonadaceae bacterium]
MTNRRDFLKQGTLVAGAMATSVAGRIGTPDATHYGFIRHMNVPSPNR